MNYAINKIIYNQYIIAIVFLAYCIFLVNTITGSHNWGDDYAGYLLQSYAVLNYSPTDFIELNSLTINGSDVVIGPTAYPWGFPLILALTNAIAGNLVFTYKLTILVYLALFILTLNLYASILLDKKFTIFFIVIMALNPFLIKQSNAILSDIPYLFFSTITLYYVWIFDKVRINKFNAIKIGILIALCILIRTNGITLLATLFFINLKYIISTQTIKENLKNLLHSFLIPFITCIFFVCSIEYFFPQKADSHIDVFLSNINLVSLYSSFLYNINQFQFFFSDSSGTYYLIFLIPFLLLGISKSLIITKPLFIYSILTFLLFTIWPGRQGLRLLLPIVPLYILYILIGFQWFLNKYKIYVYSMIVYCIFMIYLLSNIITDVKIIKQNKIQDEGPYSTSASEVFTYLINNSHEGDRIIFRKPRALRLHTGRVGVYLNHFDDKIYKYQYIVIDSSNETLSLKEAIESRVDQRIYKVFQNKDYDVYKVL